MTIEQQKEVYRQIAGEWNGDEPGIAEDRAQIALEIIEKLDEIKELTSNL